MTQLVKITDGSHEQGQHTSVIGIVLSVAQHLQGTDEVQSIHARMEGEEDVNHFMGITALRNCTHLADYYWLRWG